MFGVIRPGGGSKEVWREHMCGLCLGLRDGHGQLARATTNNDALVLSLLTEAQLGTSSRRTAGPCALRGMKTASVATADSPGVELAATASLLLGAAKAADWTADGDGRFRARLAKRPARKWHDEAVIRGQRIGLDVRPLWAAIASPTAREDAGVALDEIIWPAEFCTGELYAHSAVLAERPENLGPLRTIGRAVGRIAHLSDAIADLERDHERGAFNPITATATPLSEVEDLLGLASDEVRTATAALTLVDPEPVSTILVHGASRAVSATQPGESARGIGLVLAGSLSAAVCLGQHGDSRNHRRRNSCCDCCECCACCSCLECCDC